MYRKYIFVVFSLCLMMATAAPSLCCCMHCCTTPPSHASQHKIGTHFRSVWGKLCVGLGGARQSADERRRVSGLNSKMFLFFVWELVGFAFRSDCAIQIRVNADVCVCGSIDCIGCIAFLDLVVGGAMINLIRHQWCVFLKKLERKLWWFLTKLCNYIVVFYWEIQPFTQWILCVHNLPRITIWSGHESKELKLWCFLSQRFEITSVFYWVLQRFNTIHSTNSFVGRHSSDSNSWLKCGYLKPHKMHCNKLEMQCEQHCGVGRSTSFMYNPHNIGQQRICGRELCKITWCVCVRWRT